MSEDQDLFGEAFAQRIGRSGRPRFLTVDEKQERLAEQKRQVALRYARRHPERKRASYKKWLKNNLEYHRIWRRNSKRTRPDYLKRLLLQKARGRARQMRLEYNLTLDDITVPDLCPVLSIPIFPNTKKVCDNSPSLDRIDNRLGYIKGNVRVISFRANTLKSSGTIEEIQLVLADMIKWAEKSP